MCVCVDAYLCLFICFQTPGRTELTGQRQEIQLIEREEIKKSESTLQAASTKFQIETRKVAAASAIASVRALGASYGGSSKVSSVLALREHTHHFQKLTQCAPHMSKRPLHLRKDTERLTSSEAFSRRRVHISRQNLPLAVLGTERAAKYVRGKVEENDGENQGLGDGKETSVIVGEEA